MTEMIRTRDRNHGESPQFPRLGGLAARLGRSQGSLPAVLASSAFAEGTGPFQSHQSGGLDGSIGRGTDNFDTTEVTQ